MAKKKESTLINMLVALLVIAAVSGGVLGLVYGVTKDAIAQVDQKKNEAAIQAVLPLENVTYKADTMKFNYEGVDLTFPCNLAYDANGNFQGAAVKTSEGGFGGKIDMMVGFLADGTIKGTSVLSHAETPGLGANMTGKFKDQFVDKNPNNFKLIVKKDGGDVDAITAATITSRAFSKAVNKAYQAFMANKALQTFTKGLIKENPILVLLLGCCPTLATTTSAINGMSMGLATTFVLVLSNIFISLLKGFIPDKVRIPCFIVVIASFVTVVQLVMQAYVPDIYETLGLFIPLIVVNCIVLGRAEAFASKNPVFPSLLDGLGMGLGFTLALTLLGCLREFLGSGSIFGLTILPETANILVFILPPGAFICLGFVIAIVNKLKKENH